MNLSEIIVPTHRTRLVNQIGMAIVTLYGLLGLSGISVCPTEGCKLVSEATKINSEWIVLLGVVFLFMVNQLSSRIIRFPNDARIKRFDYPIVLGLYFAAFAAEGVFLGYQIFIGQAYCLFCLGFFVFLCISAFMTFTKSFNFLLYVVVSSVLLLIGAIDFTTTTSSRIENDLQKISAAVIGAKNHSDSNMYLFTTETCTHCQELKSVLLATPEKFPSMWSVDATKIDSKILLGRFGSSSVPTLIVMSKVGGKEMRIIKGKTDILSYLKISGTLNSSSSLETSAGACK